MIARTPGKLDWRGVPKMRAASLPHLFSIGPRLVGPTCVGAKNIKARTGPDSGSQRQRRTWVNNGPRRFAERLPLYLQIRTGRQLIGLIGASFTRPAIAEREAVFVEGVAILQLLCSVDWIATSTFARADFKARARTEAS